MSVTTGVKGINKLLAPGVTLDIGNITDGEVLIRSGTNIVSTAVTPGAVNTVTTTAPITLGGTVANPIIGHEDSGSGAGTTAFPTSITRNITGHITAITAGTQPLLATQLAQPNGVASLNSLGKIPNTQIPPLAITSTFQVPTLADLTTLTAAEEGDVGIVTSDIVVANNGAYILSTNNPTVLANWIPIESPGGGVATIAVTAPITNTGSGTNPVIGHALSGTPVGVFTNATVETNATGHIINISNGAAIPPSFQPLYRSQIVTDSGVDNTVRTLGNGTFPLFSGILVLPRGKGASFGIWTSVAGTSNRFTFATEGYYSVSYKTVFELVTTTLNSALISPRIIKSGTTVDATTYAKGANSGTAVVPAYSRYVDFFTVGETLDFNFIISGTGTNQTVYIERESQNILIERLADQ